MKLFLEIVLGVMAILFICGFIIPRGYVLFIRWKKDLDDEWAPRW